MGCVEVAPLSVEGAAGAELGAADCSVGGPVDVAALERLAGFDVPALRCEVAVVLVEAGLPSVVFAVRVAWARVERLVPPA